VPGLQALAVDRGASFHGAVPGLGLASPGIQAITGLAVSGRTLTGVGFIATPADEQPTLWQPRIRLLTHGGKHHWPRPSQ
jgi:hypothetical protein